MPHSCQLLREALAGQPTTTTKRPLQLKVDVVEQQQLCAQSVLQL